MTINYKAKVFLPKYELIYDVISGRCLPLITDGDGSYYKERRYPQIGTCTVTITLHSTDKIVQDQIAGLQMALQTARAQAHLAKKAILKKISKLQALTNKPTTA